MKYISSKENPTYKSLVKLKKKKYRDERGLYLIEGVKPLKDAIEAGCSLREVFQREGLERENLLQENDLYRGYILSQALFDKVADTENSQGVLAVTEKNILNRGDFIKLFKSERLKGSNIVLLDKLQDPGNIGTIIRTAEAAGYQGVIMTTGTTDPYAPKAARAAAGSLFRMPITTVDTEEEAVGIAKALNKRVAVSCLKGAENCFCADMSRDIVLAIGNEGNGVSPELIETADLRVKIPMEGNIESLNAAVAAGILMYRRMEYTGNER